MTTIIGYRDPAGLVWLGGDSRGHRRGFVVPWTMTKFRRLGDWRVAWAGVACVDTYLEAAAPHALATAETIIDFVMRLRAILRSVEFRNVAPDDGLGPPDYGQEWLVARPGEVWTIEGDGAYAAAEPLIAIGSGQDVAYGASKALRLCGVTDGRELILQTLAIVADFYTTTAPPFWLEYVG